MKSPLTPTTPANLRDRLLSALTEYDRRQSTKRHYNPHALGIYFQRADDICADVAKGGDPRAAIVAGFTGSLLAHVLRSLAMEKPTADELAGRGGPVYYVPASEAKGGAA